MTLSLSLQNRSGRFLLQSPENILPRAALMDCEEALNKGSTSATEVFSSLRTRSILHLLAATGSFFGLKVVYMFTNIQRCLLFSFSGCGVIFACCVSFEVPWDACNHTALLISNILTNS